jgi:hypothetical protein
MKRIAAAGIVTVLFLQLWAIAQTPTPPKPGPEVKRLGYFAGNWKLEGDMKPSPFGPGGKFIETEQNEWMDGGFFVISHTSGTSPMGKESGVSVMGYNPQEKVYTYDGYNSMGQTDHSKGTFENDTWVFTSDETMGGQSFKGRFSMKQVSPTAMTFKYESSTDGTTWTTLMEGKGTKTN